MGHMQAIIQGIREFLAWHVYKQEAYCDLWAISGL